jgi:hypothetical protein
MLSAFRKLIEFRGMWEIIGGFYLIAYCFWYLSAANRVVPHWPLDLAFTLSSGLMLFFFGFREVLRLLEKTSK